MNVEVVSMGNEGLDKQESVVEVEQKALRWTFLHVV